MTPRQRAEALLKARERASREYDTEDFNGSLLIDGQTGSFGFEMHKCDRDFIALAANETQWLAQNFIKMLDALELIVNDNRLMNAMKKDQAKAIMNAVRALAEDEVLAQMESKE